MRLIAAMAVGYTPSFALPFVVARVMPEASSDAVLLAITTAIATGSILSIPYENAWSAFAASRLALASPPTNHDVARGVRQAALVGAGASMTLLPIFALPYFFTARVGPLTLTACLVSVLAFPTAAAVASVSAGVLNAHGKAASNVALQGTRGIFPVLGAILVLLGAGIYVVGIFLCVGEFVRGSLLLLLTRNTLRVGASHPAEDVSPADAETAGTGGPPSAKSILQHVVGMAALGAAPIIDQSFLARELGAVTRFAMAERILTALTQVCNNLTILPRVPVVAERMASHGMRRTVTAELRRTLAMTLAVVVSAAIPLSLYLLGPRSTAGSGVALWALLLLVSLPANVGGILATRLVVATNQSNRIPALAATGVVLNLIGDFLGFQALGAVGILVSTIVWQYLLLVLTALLLVRYRAAEDRSMMAQAEA
jgi:hypothetical protein